MKRFPVMTRLLVSTLVLGLGVWGLAQTGLGRYFWEGDKVLVLSLAHGEPLQNYRFISVLIQDTVPHKSKASEGRVNDYAINANVGDEVRVEVDFAYKNEQVQRSCVVIILRNRCDASIAVKGKELLCSDACERSF